MQSHFHYSILVSLKAVSSMVSFIHSYFFVGFAYYFHCSVGIWFTFCSLVASGISALSKHHSNVASANLHTPYLVARKNEHFST